ncbi:MAG: MFS transporter [Gammaproteobacteria bacterium]|nr:MFS transporter [Gammaproteobacteria bacterium]
MIKTLRSLASLLLSYGLLLLANGLFNTLLGIRTRIEGFPTEVTGIIMSSYFLGLLLGGLFGARVVARVGHIRSFAAFASIMSITALLHVLWVEPFAWLIMRALSGFCMAGMIMVTESWLNERAGNEIRGQVLSLYMITNYFFAGLGQFLLPLADPAKFHLFSLVSIVFSLALLPVLMTRAEAPPPTQPHPGNVRELFRLAPLGVLGAVCAGMVNASFHGMGPVFAQGSGLSLVQTSLFMGCAIFGGLLLQWPMGRWSDRLDRRKVIMLATAATTVCCLAIVVVTGFAEFWLFVAAVFYGSFSFTVYSLCAAHTNDRAPAEQRIQTASVMLVAYGVGAAGGPMLAGALMGQLGAIGLFVQSALVMGFLTVYTYYRIRRRDASEQTKRYVPMPASQFTSDQLYTAARDQMDRDLANMMMAPRRR